MGEDLIQVYKLSIVSKLNFVNQFFLNSSFSTRQAAPNIRRIFAIKQTRRAWNESCSQALRRLRLLQPH
jgi:hypothetical protein